MIACFAPVALALALGCADSDCSSMTFSPKTVSTQYGAMPWVDADTVHCPTTYSVQHSANTQAQAQWCGNLGREVFRPLGEDCGVDLCFSAHTLSTAYHSQSVQAESLKYLAPALVSQHSTLSYVVPRLLIGGVQDGIFAPIGLPIRPSYPPRFITLLSASAQARSVVTDPSIVEFMYLGKFELPMGCNGVRPVWDSKRHASGMVSFAGACAKAKPVHMPDTLSGVIASNTVQAITVHSPHTLSLTMSCGTRVTPVRVKPVHTLSHYYQFMPQVICVDAMTQHSAKLAKSSSRTYQSALQLPVQQWAAVTVLDSRGNPVAIQGVSASDGAEVSQGGGRVLIKGQRVDKAVVITVVVDGPNKTFKVYFV